MSTSIIQDTFDSWHRWWISKQLLIHTHKSAVQWRYEAWRRRHCANHRKCLGISEKQHCLFMINVAEFMWCFLDNDWHSLARQLRIVYRGLAWHQNNTNKLITHTELKKNHDSMAKRCNSQPKEIQTEVSRIYTTNEYTKKKANLPGCPGKLDGSGAR